MMNIAPDGRNKMTTYFSLAGPIAFISFCIGMVLGFQLARHKKRLISEWLAIPIVIAFAAVLIFPPFMMLVLVFCIPLGIGTLVSMALVIAAGRKKSVKPKR